MKLLHHIHVLCKRNPDGSYKTQNNRLDSLKQSARELKSIGFNRINSLQSLKPKHIESLVKHWQKNDMSVGTIKNRMAHLRWVAEKIDRRDLIAKDNSHYGIGNRSFVGKDKSLTFTDEAIRAINDSYVAASARLQKEFGLRREEAMKIIPIDADKGSSLALKSTWCKGGRARPVPINTDLQRAALDHAKAVAGTGSLIPPNLMFKNQVNVFEREMKSVGLSRSHGARHAYAQNRYFELTGWRPPIQGGPSYKDLSDSDKLVDREARRQVSAELGHERIQITATYLGS